MLPVSANKCVAEDTHLLGLVAGMSRQNWAYVAYAATAVAAVVLLFTLVMIRRIGVAVACIKVSLSLLPMEL